MRINKRHNPTIATEKLLESYFDAGRQSRPTRRHGITLLEIMLALSVALIGVIGVMVLIPVSGRLAKQGLDYDQAANLSRSALEDFEVHGMKDPVDWVGMDPTTGAPVFVTVQPNKSYVIDPEYMGRNILVNPPIPMAQTGAFFPTNSSGLIAAPTATQPLVLTPLPSAHRITIDPFGQAFNNIAEFMTEEQAEDVFAGQDDIQVIEPEDTTFSSNQLFHGQEEFDLSGDLSRLVKPQTLRDKSWMAMLVPRPSPTGIPNASSDLYTLYIIVFKERDLNLSSQIDLATGTFVGDSERWSRISFIGGGFGGGEAMLAPFDNSIIPAAEQVNGGTADPAIDLAATRDEWLMVCQRIRAFRPNPAGVGPPIEQVYDQFRWYRVTDSSDLAPVNYGAGVAYYSAYNGPARFVSLDGPDWSTPDGDGSVQPNGFAFHPIYAVKVSGVVDVYEKTVRLETDSIWTK